jgi:hypothetical protein
MMKGEKMKKIERRGTAEEVLSLRNRPGYLTMTAGGREGEKTYIKRCLALLDAEAKKHPGFSVRMTVKNGIPRFSCIKRSLTGQALMRRMNRTLERVKGGLKENVPRDILSQRIDRTIKRVREMKWEE